MDLYSRRIIGWSMSPRMTTKLVLESLKQAYWLRKPPKGGPFIVIVDHNIPVMYLEHSLNSSKSGDVVACWDDTVVERFFGSLKHDWLLKVHQPNHEHMIDDLKAYMRYYNLERLHTGNGGMSPVEYENYKRGVSEIT